MKTFLSLLLSSLILLSNVGVTVSQHYCLGRIVNTSISLGTSAIDCGYFESPSPASCPIASFSDTKHGCCQDEYISFEIKDQYEKSSFDFSFDQFTAVPVPFRPTSVLSLKTSIEKHPSLKSPPLVRLDRQALFQSYII